MHPKIISECLVAVVVFGSGIVDESRLSVSARCLVLLHVCVSFRGVWVWGVERVGWVWGVGVQHAVGCLRDQAPISREWGRACLLGSPSDLAWTSVWWVVLVGWLFVKWIVDASI